MSGIPGGARRGRWLWWAATVAIAGVLAWEHFPAPGVHKAKDWQFFYAAAEALRAGADPYDAGGGGYIYPPLLAWALTPLTPLGFQGSARVWVILSGAGILAGLVLATRETTDRLRATTGLQPPRLGWAVFVGLLLSVNVARREIEHAQTDWLTMLGFVLGMMWMDRRPLAAGAALGLAANIKYQTLIVVPYLLVRGRFRAAASTMAFAVAAALLPAVTIGWDRNLEYLRRALGGIAQFVGIEMPGRARVWPLEHPDNISIAGVLARASAGMGGGKGLTLALAGAAAGACLGLAWMMYRANGLVFWGRPAPRGQDPGVRGQASGSVPAGPLVLAAEWAGLMVVSVAFSPQTLKRHFLILAPVYAVAVVMLLSRRQDGRGAAGKGILLAGLGMSLIAMFFPPRWDGLEAWSDAWRASAGTCWGQVVLFFALLWTALRWERPGNHGAGAQTAREPAAQGQAT